MYLRLLLFVLVISQLHPTTLTHVHVHPHPGPSHGHPHPPPVHVHPPPVHVHPAPDCDTEGLEPLLDIPDLVRTYPMMLHRFTSIVDFVLGIAMDYVNMHNADHVRIPDLERTLMVTVHGLSHSSNFRGEGGWVESMSTLTRDGEISSNKYRRGAVSLTIPLTFGSLTVGFDKYTFPIASIARLVGTINIKINDNRLILKTLIAVPDGEKVCTFSLEDLKIERLGDFDATITGLFPFNWLVQTIVKAIVQGHRSMVRGELEARFRTETRKFLKLVPCGDVCNS